MSPGPVFRRAAPRAVEEARPLRGTQGFAALPFLRKPFNARELLDGV